MQLRDWRTRMIEKRCGTNNTSAKIVNLKAFKTDTKSKSLPSAAFTYESHAAE